MSNHTSANGLHTPCPVCGGTDIAPLIDLRQVPVHCNVLWPTREAALQAPRGDMRLGFCRTCGHIFNAAFDPGRMEYTAAYENSLHFSPHFQNYAEALAQRLIERYDLRGKTVIEIGCGKGEFLDLLCRLGGNRGLGFDPSYIPGPNGGAASQPFIVIRDLYSERYAGYTADLIACRHVLEHIQFPRDFLASVRRSIGERVTTAVFFEVPNALYTLRGMGIWDLIYEHCSYFSAGSLARLFALSGFEVREVSEAYGGQFLGLEAAPDGDATRNPSRVEIAASVTISEAETFANRYRGKVGEWSETLEQLAQSGRRLVVWGAGSKGVTFLNVLRVRDQLEYVVDLNPRKHGMHIAGTGQRIVPPEFLRGYRPNAVLVMNPLYQTEIQQALMEIGVDSELICA
jgi:SAM-dependent methyltransferase